MKPTHCIANRALLLSLVLVSGGVIAAESLQGQVLGAGAPIANSTVTLWAATSGPPAQLGQARTGADGRFSLNATIEGAKDASLYLVAKGGKSAADKTTGDNSAIALMCRRFASDDRGHDQRTHDRGVGMDGRAVLERRHV